MSCVQIIDSEFVAYSSLTAIPNDSDVKLWWSWRVCRFHSFWCFHVVHDGDVEAGDGTSVSVQVHAFTIMRAFAQEWGLVEEVAHGLAEYKWECRSISNIGRPFALRWKKFCNSVCRIYFIQSIFSFVIQDKNHTCACFWQPTFASLLVCSSLLLCTTRTAWHCRNDWHTLGTWGAHAVMKLLPATYLFWWSPAGSSSARSAFSRHVYRLQWLMRPTPHCQFVLASSCVADLVQNTKSSSALHTLLWRKDKPFCFMKRHSRKLFTPPIQLYKSAITGSNRVWCLRRDSTIPKCLKVKRSSHESFQWKSSFTNSAVPAWPSLLPRVLSHRFHCSTRVGDLPICTQTEVKHVCTKFAKFTHLQWQQ